jgi:hypothetical protein
LVGRWFSRLPQPYWSAGCFRPLGLTVLYWLTMFEPQVALVPARGPEQGQSSPRTPFGSPRLTAKKWPNQAKNSTSPNPTNEERFS